MAASRTISIRLTVAEADQFKQAFAQAGAAGQAAMATIAKATAATTASQHANTQAGQLQSYQLIELAESAHKFADGILSGGSALKAFAYEAPNFVAIAGGMKNALSAISTALPLLGVAAAAAGIYELGKAAEEQQSRLLLLGQQVRATRDDYDSYAETLDKTARSLAQHTTLSTKDARDTVNTLGTNPNFSGNAADLTRLATDANNLSVVLRTDLAGATKIISDGMNDAAKAAKDLGDKGFAGFTPELVRSIGLMQQAGKYADAFSLFLKTVEARSSGAADAGLTPLGAALKRLDEAFNGSRDGAKSFSEDVGGFIDAMVTRGITNLSRLIETLHSIPQITRDALTAAPVNPDTQAATTPDATGRPVLLGPPIPGREERAHGIMQVLPSTAAGFHLNPDIQDQNILAGLEDLQQKIGQRGSVDAGLAAYGGAVSPDKAAAYVSGVRGQNIAKLPADVSSQIEYWGQILGLPPDLITLGKQIALQESGGHQYTSGSSATAAPAASTPTLADAQKAGAGLPSPNGYAADGMINAGRRTDEQVNSEIEGTRAATGEKLAATLDGIEKQLQQFELTGRQGSTEYAGLLQREQETQAAIRNNLDPQQRATREGQDQLDSARLARRYGFTPADQALQAEQDKRQEIARTTGSPVTPEVTNAVNTQFFEKANMELSRLEATQKQTAAGSEALAKAYSQGGQAVADYTAKNEALQQIGTILPKTAANYAAELDKLTASYRRVAQAAADLKAAQSVANDNKAITLSTQQDALIRSGAGPDQTSIAMAGLSASQQNDAASPAARAAAISAAQQKTQAALMVQNTKANYDELTNFASNSFDKIGSDITQAFTQGATAAKSFGSIGKAVISDLSQELLKLAFINPLKNALLGSNSSLPTLTGVGGILGSLLGSSKDFSTAGAPQSAGEQAFVTAAGAATSTAGSGISSFFSSLFHGGGIAGRSSGAGMRMVDPSVFYGAQRLHNGGLAGDEVPTVLKAGEGVFTPGQMAALGAGAAANSNGGDTHLHLNINAQGAGQREIDSLRNSIPGMALAAVQNAMVRNGKFANQVRGRSS